MEGMDSFPRKRDLPCIFHACDMCVSSSLHLPHPAVYLAPAMSRLPCALLCSACRVSCSRLLPCIQPPAATVGQLRFVVPGPPQGAMLRAARAARGNRCHVRPHR